ncbi:hypothetical protein E2C01_047569 [Portunus trituberculatus]|uniref:Uncharacterized protein n=1 Tax=Portunus trituberculatus TaxID=210409 RepID=A0A5B7G1G3_PORTR|nr:hypothetical protein [Portunus trituberculatus]
MSPGRPLPSLPGAARATSGGTAGLEVSYTVQSSPEIGSSQQRGEEGGREARVSESVFRLERPGEERLRERPKQDKEAHHDHPPQNTFHLQNSTGIHFLKRVMSQVQGTTDRYNSSGELPHKQNKEEHTDAITAANLPQRLMVLKWWCGGQAAVPCLLPECLPPSLPPSQLPMYSHRTHTTTLFALLCPSIRNVQ